jgi:hypothetical protein
LSYISSVNKIGIQNMNVIYEYRSGQQLVIGKGLLDYHRVSQPYTLKTTTLVTILRILRMSRGKQIMSLHIMHETYAV